jgi:hypothetical protein
VAENGNHQRKPDFRTAVEDTKALAKVLVIDKLTWRNPAALFAIGVVVTISLALVVVMALLRTGPKTASRGWTRIHAALQSVRARTSRALRKDRNHDERQETPSQ